MATLPLKQKLGANMWVIRFWIEAELIDGPYGLNLSEPPNSAYRLRPYRL
jgi:hypothetical protein